MDAANAWLVAVAGWQTGHMVKLADLGCSPSKKNMKGWIAASLGNGRTSKMSGISRMRRLRRISRMNRVRRMSRLSRIGTVSRQCGMST